MSIEAVLLLATALLAVVAVTAAGVAVRAVRHLRPGRELGTDISSEDAPSAPVEQPERATLPVRIVEGRVIATPTEEQVVATALGRPAVRLSIYASGLVHALRPESRDRIVALMRREYRHRRRVRQRIARRAARTVPAQALHRDATWLGAPDATERRSLPRAAGE